ncbi:MAG: DegT/DnrJ/EryC1/StrS family aminotransferase [Candidatus Sungiibacteriota bacterium]
MAFTANMFSFLQKLASNIQHVEDAAIERAISRVLRKRTHYGFTGHPHVKAFENELSKKLGWAPVIGTNSGTDALILSLKILGIGPGDEVIVPAFSFISTASCISWIGAKPVFVDIREDDFSCDPIEIKKNISLKTKAIIVAHLFGHPAGGLEEIVKIAKLYQIPVIEDAAQSFGAEMQINGAWKLVGTIGDIGCLSFSSTKPFSAPGNGGAIVFNTHRDLFEVADAMRLYGAKKHYFDYPFVGINIKLQEIQAAALLAKLPFMDYWLNHRKKLAERYTAYLSSMKNLILPKEFQDSQRIWYRYVIRTDSRDQLFNHLTRNTQPNQLIQPSKNYPVPLPYFDAFKDLGHRKGDFPIADAVSSEVLSLPITNFVTSTDVDRICELIGQFGNHAASNSVK